MFFQKKCIDCGEMKPREKFRDGHNQCKLCLLARKRALAAIAKGLDPDEAQRKNRARYQRHRDKSIQRARRNALALRAEVITHYGGHCVCCGETNLKFLTIDHIYEDGAQCRRDTNTRGGTRYYYWIKENGFPDFLRVLCYNCNLATYRNGGICPHEETRLKLAA